MQRHLNLMIDNFDFIINYNKVYIEYIKKHCTHKNNIMIFTMKREKIQLILNGRSANIFDIWRR